MPKVFVHGNPECDAVWNPLIEALAARGINDTVRLSPPGFGASVPDGFEATMQGYHQWLVSELEAISGPIDLVGHDWGAGHVAGIAAARPDLIRSFAMDCGGLVHPDYVWHDAAQSWQTPEVGEEVVQALTGAPLADRIGIFESFGITGPAAQQMAKAANAEMAASILTLYRSAVQPAMADLGKRLRQAPTRPALIIIAEDDLYVSADLAGETAADLGAQVLRLSGQGHWWMFGAPEIAAQSLAGFWSGLHDAPESR
jgi:pimeloyl-ACP methyl ester carboxylesterase